MKRAWTAGLALGLPVLLLWPWALHPTQLPAHPLGEGTNHAWMFWRAFQDGPVANWPEGLAIPLMDPVNLPLAVLGLQGVVYANLVLAFLGAWALARALDATEAGAATAGVAAMSAPVLLGFVDMGLTESLPIGWLGLHAAALIRWGDTGRQRWWLAASLALAAFALSGWYHALFGLVVELPLAAWVLWRSRRPLGVLAQGVLAAALVLPRALAHDSAIWAHRFVRASPHPPELRPHWRELPVFGTDLLNLVQPALESVGPSKSVYIGVVGLALALLGRRRGLLLLAVPLWVLALGHHLSVAGHVAFALPAKFIPLDGVSHWHRAAGPASIFLAVAAGFGAERLPRWWIAPTLLVLDSLMLSQTAFPRALTDPTPPAVYEQVDGVLLELPFDNRRVDFGAEIPRRSNLYQPSHGQPVAENHEGVDALLSRPSIRAADGACFGDEPPPSLDLDGIEQVLVVEALCPSPEGLLQALTLQLGEPITAEGGWLFRAEILPE